MLTITRRIPFCAGHRLPLHKGGCRNLHGHNYVLRVTIVAPETKEGMVLDFADVKRAVKGWIDENWDHAFIADRTDRDVLNLIDSMDMRRYIMPEGPPTAEGMAEHLLCDVLPDLLGPLGCVCIRVEIEETENCVASCSLDNAEEMMLPRHGGATA